MRSDSTSFAEGGHPPGGPLFFSACPGRVRTGASLCAAALLFAAAGVACSGGGRGVASRPDEGATTSLARPLDIYRELGFMTGTGAFPAVTSVVTVAGPADSTFVLVGMSIPNMALRFVRDADGFSAGYTVDLLFMEPDSTPVKREHVREVVRVASFAETSRAEESVIFQHAATLLPGRYLVGVQVVDVHSARGFMSMDTLAVPAHTATAARLSTPAVVYEGTGRSGRGEPPALIMNPRHTVPYGGDAPLIYIESYAADPVVELAVVNDEGTAVWRTTVRLTDGGDSVRYALLRIPAHTLPLGRFRIEAGEPGAIPAHVPLVLAISDQWMLSNFDEVLQFLRYIAHADELDALRAGSVAERRLAWEAFWSRRDPLPGTGVNEYRESFFHRVRHATEVFHEPGRPGWQTQRGEVFIVLGPPDHVVQRIIGRADISGRPNAEEWIYRTVGGGRLNLLFHDRGFGRLDLVPASMAAFRNAAERMKPRSAGGN
jgi:GWxTD domain-containing protein